MILNKKSCASARDFHFRRIIYPVKFCTEQTISFEALAGFIPESHSLRQTIEFGLERICEAVEF